MIAIKNRAVSIMVLYCIALHLFWVLMIWLNLEALNATPVDAVHRVVTDPFILVVVLLASSGLALVAIVSSSPWWIVLLLIPQEILLLISASGAFTSIYLGQFADGVVRPWEFIAADQIHIILAALGHTIAIIMHARRKVTLVV